MSELTDIDQTSQEPIIVTQVNSFTKETLFSYGMYEYYKRSQTQWIVIIKPIIKLPIHTKNMDIQVNI